ncbi:MAG: Smr/MutS family protein [Dehalococcoidales bacterium]|nr:Smr/MutS family protein [Dehalococcoidales bacterium]
MSKEERSNIAPQIHDEVYIRRMTIDEALSKLDKYLNDAFMAGIIRIKIVHGKGTGILRQVVHERLSKHPLVKFYRLGEYREGEEGVTIAELYHRQAHI